MSKIRFLLLPAFFIIVFVTTIWIPLNKGASHRNLIIWDTEGYYIYLPAIFIYHSFVAIPTQTFMDAAAKQPYLQPWPGTNKIYTKYTCGEAIMLAPFWLVAHGIALFFPDKYAPDGFSFIYDFAIIVAMAFYLVFGLYVASLILRPYFSESIVLLSLLSIWLGTSFIQYTAFQPGMSHVFSFLLICLFVLMTPWVISRLTYKLAFIYAIIYALIVLVRVTNGIVILFLLFYNVRSINEFRIRVQFFLKNINYFSLFSLLFFVVISPQFIYWHYITGHWEILTYAGEHFSYWENPKMWQVLFHPQNGFFVYAPVMLLALPGFVIGWSDSRFDMPLYVVILTISIYIFGSWWCWWFGAAYGHRAFIDFFIFLLIPLCMVYQKILNARFAIRGLALTVIFFFLFLSVRMNMIYTYPWDGPNWGWKNVSEKYKQALFIK